MANIKDFAVGLVVTAPSPALSGTTLTLRTGEGATMPVAPFYATATPPGQLTTTGTSEKILVTNVTGDVLTFTRAQTPTTAQSIAVGWVVANAIYASDIFSTITFGEVPSGTPNGVLTAFTTAQPYTSIEVFKNGVRMKGGGEDYTNTNSTTITFVAAPAAGTVLLVNYTIGNSIMVVGSNSLITNATPSGTVNSSNTVFTTANPYIGNSLEVFINGISQKRGTHFTETTPTTGSFTMGDAPTAGDDIMVSYQFVSATTGNADTVDGFHASATPTANTIPVLDSNALIPNATIGSAWTPYTPSWTGLTIGNATVTARYSQIGKTVRGRIYVALGTTSSVTSSVSVSLPITASSYAGTSTIQPIGMAVYWNGTTASTGQVQWESTTLARLYVTNAATTYAAINNLSATIPTTWTTGNEIQLNFEYEAA